MTALIPATASKTFAASPPSPAAGESPRRASAPVGGAQPSTSRLTSRGDALAPILARSVRERVAAGPVLQRGLWDWLAYVGSYWPSSATATATGAPTSTGAAAAAVSPHQSTVGTPDRGKADRPQPKREDVKQRLDEVRDRLEVNPAFEAAELEHELADRAEDHKILRDLLPGLEAKLRNKQYDQTAVKRAITKHKARIGDVEALQRALEGAQAALERRPRPEEGKRKNDWDVYLARYERLVERFAQVPDNQWRGFDNEVTQLKDHIDAWRGTWWNDFERHRKTSRHLDAKVAVSLSKQRAGEIAIPLHQRTPTSAPAAPTGTSKPATASTPVPPAAFHPERPATWKLNPIEFSNGVTEETITGAVGGKGVLDRVRAGHIRPHGASGRNADPRVGQRFHAHLAGGAWGLAFIYVRERDDTVTPCVYDIAYSRPGNQYKWVTGSTGYNSDAPIPLRP